MLASAVAFTLLTVVAAVVFALHRRVRRLERQQRHTQAAVADAGEVIASLVTGHDPRDNPAAVPPHRRRRRHLRALPVVLAPAVWVAHQARHRPALAASGAALTLAAGVATVPLLLGPEPSTGQLDLAPPPPPEWTVPAHDPTPSPDPDPSPPLNGHPTTPPESAPEVPAPSPRPESPLDAEPHPEPPDSSGNSGNSGGGGGELPEPEPEPEPTQPPQTTPPAEPSPEPADDPEPEADGLLCVRVGLPPLLDTDLCLL